jgi:hypothetical protein
MKSTLGVSIFLLEWAIDLKFCMWSWHNSAFKSGKTFCAETLLSKIMVVSLMCTVHSFRGTCLYSPTVLFPKLHFGGLCQAGFQFCFLILVDLIKLDTNFVFPGPILVDLVNIDPIFVPLVPFWCTWSNWIFIASAGPMLVDLVDLNPNFVPSSPILLDLIKQDPNFVSPEAKLLDVKKLVWS